ncbi:sphingomyelin phosphodiesterase 4 isoform X2 [Dermacentor albipictus]|uniref:sphingomyelin phosphodiesterase 4 isoform X2 n=1 Tax=Dermacentor albipictus TaxID=60249 RepID=UPI0031FD8E8E
MAWRNALSIFSMNNPSSPLLNQQQGCLVAALDTYPLDKRCHELSRLFHELPFKELQHYLPTVLEHVFGFGANVGWGLQNISLGQPGFEALRRFLSPEGPLLLLVYRLLSDASVKYDFPVSCLPSDTQRTLSTGGVPPFCTGRIPSFGGGPQAPTALQINAFELYMFHFAYYIVNPSQPGAQHQVQQPVLLDIVGGEGQKASGTILESLYLALLQDYLHYYLPHDRDDAPELPGYHPHHQMPFFAGSTPPSVLYRDHRDTMLWHGTSPGGLCPNSTGGVPHRHPNNEPCLIRKDILANIYSGSGSGNGCFPSTPPRYYGSTMTSTPAAGFATSVMSPVAAVGCGNPHARISETFLEVLLEFWLGRQQVATAMFGRPPAGATMLYGSPGATPTSTSFHHTFRVTEDSCVPSQFHMLIARVMVKHLHQFRYSVWRNNSSSTVYPCNIQTPMDDIKLKVLPRLFRKRLYMFLKHALSSWPLDSSFRLPLETWLSFIQPWRYASSHNKLGDRQKSHGQGVEAHWQPFVQEHLLFYTELLSVLLQRFCRMELASRHSAYMLYRVTKVFFQPNLFTMITEAEASLGSASRPTSPASSALQRQAVSAPVATLVRQHMADIEEPGFTYRPLNGDERRKQVTCLVQLAGQACRSINRQLEQKLGTMGHQDSDSTQQHDHLSRASSSTGSSSWWGLLKRGARRVLSSLLSPGAPDEVAEWKRTQNYLHVSVDELCRAFKLNKDAELSALPPESGRELVSLFASSRDMTDSVRRHNGFRQNGFEHCLDDTKAYTYQGNPDMEPIRSYEVVFLVRMLHLLSTAINDKYGHQLESLYDSPDFLGHVARLLLQPPTVYKEVVKRGIGMPHDYRQHRLPARLCLRTLAHKQFIGYLCILLFLGYTWDYSPFTVCLIVLECFSVGLLLRATWSWGVQRLPWRHHQAMD